MKRYGKAAVITGGIILFLFMVVTAGEAWIKHKIRNIIESEQAGLTSGVYLAEAGRIRISIPARSIRIDDVLLKTSGSTRERAGSRIRSIEAGIRQVAISGIRFKKTGDKYALEASEMTLDTPSVAINGNISGETDSTANVLHGRAASFAVGNLQIKEGAFEYIMWGRDDSNGRVKNHYRAGGVQLDAENISYDGNFSVGDIRSFIKLAEYIPETAALSLTLDSVNIDTHGKSLTVSAVRLTPAYSEYEYAANVAGHPDWTRITSGAISCSGVDYEKLKAGKRLRIDSVAVASAAISSYKNRQLLQREREKSLFFIGLQNMEYEISIPVIEVCNTDISYEELAPDGLTPGRITINGLNGRFDGLTNIAGERARFILECRGRLQNTGELNARFTFPVSRGDTRFTASGTLGPMAFAPFNDAIVPLSDIRIDSGNMKGLSYEISGDITQANVTLQFLYEGLSVSLLKRRNGKLTERRFISRIIDGMVLHPENPDRRGTYTATGSFTRNPFRSQFNYLWKTIFTGVEHTAAGRRRN